MDGLNELSFDTRKRNDLYIDVSYSNCVIKVSFVNGPLKMKESVEMNRLLPQV